MTALSRAAILLAAVLPALLVVLQFAARHRPAVGPRPIGIALLCGIFCVVPSVAIELALRAPLERVQDATAYALFFALSIGLAEEGTKFTCLLVLCRKSGGLDRASVAVLALAIGMGFAATENLAYLAAASGAWQGTALLRAGSAIGAHAFCALLMGVIAGRFLIGRGGGVAWLLGGFAAAALVHAAYDAPLLLLKAITETHGENIAGAVLLIEMAIVLVPGIGAGLLLFWTSGWSDGAAAQGGRPFWLDRRAALLVPTFIAAGGALFAIGFVFVLYDWMPAWHFLDVPPEDAAETIDMPAALFAVFPLIFGAALLRQGLAWPRSAPAAQPIIASPHQG